MCWKKPWKGRRARRIRADPGHGATGGDHGPQTQVGTVKFNQLHRLELPVMVQRKHHYALITEVSDGRVLLADPSRVG